MGADRYDHSRDASALIFFPPPRKRGRGAAPKGRGRGPRLRGLPPRTRLASLPRAPSTAFGGPPPRFASFAGEDKQNRSRDTFLFAPELWLIRPSPKYDMRGGGAPTGATIHCPRWRSAEARLAPQTSLRELAQTSCGGALASRRSTAALARLLHLTQLQARFSGTRSKRALPALSRPGPVKAPHAPAVVPEDMMPKAARERIANPRAGTALAPPLGLASREALLDERDGRLVTEIGTDVKRNVSLSETIPFSSAACGGGGEQGEPEGASAARAGSRVERRNALGSFQAYSPLGRGRSSWGLKGRSPSVRFVIERFGD